mgnify:CR=1 FL=1
MKIPRLGLYSRFFALFGLATILLAAILAFGVAMLSETDAKEIVKERNERFHKILTTAFDGPVDLEKLKKKVKKPIVEILVIKENEEIRTSDVFPDISILLAKAEKIDALYFVKHQSRYYLMAKSDTGKIVVTSKLLNWLIYPGWMLVIPWILAASVICISYWLLHRLLKPIKEARSCASMVSQGHFDYRIQEHPKTELAELTHGLNKMASDLQQLFDAKSDVLLAISHELRTPLARMGVSLAMLEKNDIVCDLQNDIKHMDRLIEQLLEGERLQQGHKVLHLSTYFVPTLVDEMLGESEVKARIDLLGDIPEAVLNIDVGRIKFLLRNLLQNAIKHSATDTGITLSSHISGDYLVFEVKDNGKGIPEEAQEHIFEPFYCVEHTTHRDTQGTGLGLYLCQRIAQAHGGKLSVKSSLGEGCTFTLSLPLAN